MTFPYLASTLENQTKTGQCSDEYLILTSRRTKGWWHRHRLPNEGLPRCVSDTDWLLTYNQVHNNSTVIQQTNLQQTNRQQTNTQKKQPTTSHSTSCNTTLYNLQLVHNAFAQHTTTFNRHGKSSCDPHLVLWYGEDFDPTCIVVVLSSGSDPFTSLCHLINCPLPANQGTLSCLTKWRVQTICCWHDVHLSLGSISTFHKVVSSWYSLGCDDLKIWNEDRGQEICALGWWSVALVLRILKSYRPLSHPLSTTNCSIQGTIDLDLSTYE